MNLELTKFKECNNGLALYEVGIQCNGFVKTVFTDLLKIVSQGYTINQQTCEVKGADININEKDLSTIANSNSLELSAHQSNRIIKIFCPQSSLNTDEVSTNIADIASGVTSTITSTISNANYIVDKMLNLNTAASNITSGSEDSTIMEKATPSIVNFFNTVASNVTHAANVTATYAAEQLLDLTNATTANTEESILGDENITTIDPISDLFTNSTINNNTSILFPRNVEDEGWTLKDFLVIGGTISGLIMAGAGIYKYCTSKCQGYTFVNPNDRQSTYLRGVNPEEGLEL